MKFRLSKTDIFNALIIFIISCLFVLDLFVNKGQPASFDEPTHLTNIAMFYKSIKEGQFHVTWTDGFANYGMPIGVIAQQVTSYLGGLINFIVGNVITAYNLVIFIGVFLSTLFFYFFLRLNFKEKSSLVGAFLFHFAPYRIINIYIRGDIPEFFAGVFLPLILIGLYLAAHKKTLPGFILITLSTAFLILTHPMMVIVYGFIIGPYFLYLCYKNTNIIKFCLISFFAFILGLGLTGYYIIPLLFEIKYFYYGLGANHAVPNQFMSLINFIDPNWHYFYKNDIFPRGHFIESGLFETIVFIGGAIYLVLTSIKNKKISINMLLLSIIIGVIIIALMTKEAFPIFLHINFISSIQHQWRLFSSFIYLPPLILAYILNKYEKKFLIIIFVVMICLMRFPQLYGKNYTLHQQSEYFFNPENLHANIMNTIWTGPTQDYPIKKNKGEIIEGKGEIKYQKVSNIERLYTVQANTKIRMADYTFYFPGWKVLVDGKDQLIQFQDPSYRGVITYEVPQGLHNIKVEFTKTKIRILGMIFSLISITTLFALVLLSKRKKLFK